MKKLFRRITSAVLASVMIITQQGIAITYADETEDSDLTIYQEVNEDDFVFEDSTGTIIGYTGADSYVCVPEVIANVRVTSIDKAVFKNNNQIVYV